MKTRILLFAVLIMSLNACTKDPINTTEVLNNVANGTWKVTKFIDSGKNETSDFQGFTFTFTDNGGVTATSSNGTVYNGNWTSEDHSSDDHPKGDSSKFILFISGPNFLTEINEDWDILSMTDKKIELKHVSGGNGGTDFLTFDK